MYMYIDGTCKITDDVLWMMLHDVFYSYVLDYFYMMVHACQNKSTLNHVLIFCMKCIFLEVILSIVVINVFKHLLHQYYHYYQIIESVYPHLEAAYSAYQHITAHTHLYTKYT